MIETLLGYGAGVLSLLIGMAIGYRYATGVTSDVTVQTKRLDALQALFHEWKTQASEEIGAIYAFMQKYDLEAQDKIKKDLLDIERTMKANGIDGGEDYPTDRLCPRKGSRL